MREQAIAVELTERGPSNLVLLTLELTHEEDVWEGTCIELGTSAYALEAEQITVGIGMFSKQLGQEPILDADD